MLTINITGTVGAKNIAMTETVNGLMIIAHKGEMTYAKPVFTDYITYLITLATFFLHAKKDPIYGPDLEATLYTAYGPQGLKDIIERGKIIDKAHPELAEMRAREYRC